MGDKRGGTLGDCTAADCETTPAEGITLCHHHTTRLQATLQRVPDVWEDVHVTACRLDVGAGTVGGGGAHAGSRPPANLDALDRAQDLRIILNGWASHLPQLRPIGDPPVLAAWLGTQMDDITRQDWAGVLLQELTDALQACTRTTDRAGQHVFAGMCPTENEATVCGEPLYALTGRPYARCRACGQEWDVADWRARALAAAGHTTGTAAEISRMLSDPVTREALPQATIRQWARRGKLIAHSRDDLGRPVYLVHEVRALWAATKDAAYKRTQLVA